MGKYRSSKTRDVGPVVAEIAQTAGQAAFDGINNGLGVDADVIVIVRPHEGATGDAVIASITVETSNERSLEATKATMEAAYTTILSRKPNFEGSRPYRG